MLLSHIHVETGGNGNPDAYNEGSSAVGLGQTLQWVDGVRYLGGPSRSKPYIHPRARINGLPVNWIPAQQVKNLVAVFLGHLSRNTDNHIPSASHAYASGAGNVRDIVNGEPVPTGSVWRQHHDYIPRVYLALAPQYAAWVSAWKAAGYPVSAVSVESGRGSERASYRLELAPGDLEPDANHIYAQPFDGRLVYRGKTVYPEAWKRPAEQGQLDWRLKLAAGLGSAYLAKKLVKRFFSWGVGR